MNPPAKAKICTRCLRRRAPNCFSRREDGVARSYCRPCERELLEMWSLDHRARVALGLVGDEKEGKPT